MSENTNPVTAQDDAIPLTDAEALARVVWAAWPMPAMSQHEKPARWEDDYAHMHQACCGVANALLASDKDGDTLYKECRYETKTARWWLR
jgi:hypothetical protein